MRILKIVFVLVFCVGVGLPWTVAAEYNDAGTEGLFSFGVEARAVGLGRAYTGVADDASAIFWNPGGLAQLQKKELTTLYVPLYESTDYAFLSLAYPVSQLGTLGLGFMGASVRGIPKTDEFDNSLGEFSDLQLEVMISYSRAWWNHISAGVNLTFFHHILDTYSGTGIGVDLGVFYDAQEWAPGLTLGLAATNVLMPRVTLISEPDIYPLNLRLGAAYQWQLDKSGDQCLLFAVEAEKAEYTDFKPHAGLEYRAFKLASLRAGWDQDHVTAGAGISYWDLRLDYALALQPDFGPTHLISLGWRFGLSLDEEEAQRRQEVLVSLAQAKAADHNQKGLKLFMQGNYSMAVVEFEKALSWVEKSPEISANLAKAKNGLQSEQAKKKYQEGLKFYDKAFYVDAMLAWKEAMALDSEYPDLQKQIKRARDAMEKQFTRTVKKTTRKKSAKIEKSQDLFRQGISDYLEGKFSDAVRKWQSALKMDPSFSQAKLYLAKAQERLNETAPRETRRAPEAVDRQRVEQLYEQGLVKYRQRKFNEARELWNMVMSLDPSHQDANRGLERIEAILKVFEERGVK